MQKQLGNSQKNNQYIWSRETDVFGTNAVGVLKSAKAAGAERSYLESKEAKHKLKSKEC